MPLLPKDVDVIELGYKKSRFAIILFCMVMYEKNQMWFFDDGILNILIGAFRWALPSKTMFIARKQIRLALRINPITL